jgi:hypothetical protein
MLQVPSYGGMVMNFLRRLFSGRPDQKQDQKPDSAKRADLGQKAAKEEAASKEQLQHMEGGAAPGSAKPNKAKPPQR